MVDRINNNNLDLNNVCFNDKCTFYLNWTVNKQNFRYWSNENSHIFVEGYTKYSEKINAWAAIVGYQVIGPMFVNKNLHNEIYLDVLRDVINHLITEAVVKMNSKGMKIPYWMTQDYISNKMVLVLTTYFIVRIHFQIDE